MFAEISQDYEIFTQHELKVFGVWAERKPSSLATLIRSTSERIRVNKIHAIPYKNLVDGGFAFEPVYISTFVAPIAGYNTILQQCIKEASESTLYEGRPWSVVTPLSEKSHEDIITRYCSLLAVKNSDVIERTTPIVMQANAKKIFLPRTDEEYNLVQQSASKKNGVYVCPPERQRICQFT